jgi:hypothetical protein
MAESLLVRKSPSGIKLNDTKIVNYVAGETLNKGDIACTYDDFSRITLEDNPTYVVQSVTVLSNTRFAAILRQSSNYFVRTYEVNTNTKLVTSRSSYFNLNFSIASQSVIKRINSTSFWIMLLNTDTSNNIVRVLTTDGSTVTQSAAYNTNSSSLVTSTLYAAETYHNNMVLVRIFRNGNHGENIGYSYWQSYTWNGASSISINGGGSSRVGSGFVGGAFVKTDESGGITVGKQDGGVYAQRYIAYSVSSGGSLSFGSTIFLTDYNNSPGVAPVLDTYFNSSSNGYAFILYNPNQGSIAKIKRVQRSGTSVSDLGDIDYNSSTYPVGTFGMDRISVYKEGVLIMIPEGSQNSTFGARLIKYNKTAPYAITEVLTTNRQLNNFVYNGTLDRLASWTGQRYSRNERNELFFEPPMVNERTSLGPYIVNSRTVIKNTPHFEKVVGIVNTSSTAGNDVEIIVPVNS